MKKDIQDYGRLLRFIKPHMAVLFTAFICMLVYSIVNGISPTALIPVLDNIVSGSQVTIPSHVQVPGFIVALVDGINSLPQMKLVIILLIGALLWVSFALALRFSKDWY